MIWFCFVVMVLSAAIYGIGAALSLGDKNFSRVAIIAGFIWAAIQLSCAIWLRWMA